MMFLGIDRITGLVLFALETQELLNGGKRCSVHGSDDHTASRGRPL